MVGMDPDEDRANLLRTVSAFGEITVMPVGEDEEAVEIAVKENEQGNKPV